MPRKDYKVISSLDLRYNFPIIRKGLKRKQKYVLLYHGEPIAEMSPPGKEVKELFFENES